MSDDYANRISGQIDQYREDKNIHDLPEIFHIWSNLYLADAIKQIFSEDSFFAICADQFLACSRNATERPTFLSLGCGDGAVEIDVARHLHERGLQNFEFICLDLSPILIDRFRGRIPPELASCFTLRVSDINKQAIPGGLNAAMAHHSLHHMVDLEEIFASVHAGLHDDGVLVTSDMIGRNGHMRWPETKLFVDFFWPFLTMGQRRHVLLNRTETAFMDHDCSTEAFEGIRAQDILRAILQAGFHPQKFLGFGGVTDSFVDRGFGHNFSLSSPDDVFLIKRIGFLEELLLDADLIKPTQMIACFVKHPSEELCYRNRTAAASIRPTDADPAWLKGALRDFARLMTDPDFIFREKAADDHLVKRLQAALGERDNAIAALRASTSWRLTAPLRALRRLIGFGAA